MITYIEDVSYRDQIQISISHKVAVESKKVLDKYNESINGKYLIFKYNDCIYEVPEYKYLKNPDKYSSWKLIKEIYYDKGVRIDKDESSES